MIYAKGIQITPHFNSSEFMCKCGCGMIDISERLVERLEILRNILNTPIFINSGYRCKQHDKNVGGTGYGAHTLGIAVDIRTIKYSAKEISEYANFLNFGGIGLITDNDIHLDIRDENCYVNNFWHGDERTGRNINIKKLKLVKE